MSLSTWARRPTPTTRAEFADAARGALSAARTTTASGRPVLWLTTGFIAIAMTIGAWQRRWIADDGLIVLRTVRNLLAGNGPVFNAGERVEANTSTVWTYLVWFFSWLSDAQLEYVVLTIGLVLSISALPVAILACSRLYRGGRKWSELDTPLLLLPGGAIIYVALPPARDFATSGLEVPLVIFWLALLFWQMVWWSQHRGEGRRWAIGTLLLAFNAGLSVLVRPELALIGALMLGILVACELGWRLRLGVIAAAGALPVGYEIFRLGYYALPVPNTAVAKDASGSKWGQGWKYLTNLADPYQLWIPLIALLAIIPAIALASGKFPRLREHGPLRALGEVRVNWNGLTALRHGLRSPKIVVIAFLLSGVLQMLYWTRQGGDFMHGRVLLAPLFCLLLPIMVLPVAVPAAGLRTQMQAWTAPIASALLWVLIAGWGLSTALGSGLNDPTVIPRSGIVDERAFYSLQSNHAHPLTASDYLDYPRMRALQVAIEANPQGAVYIPGGDFTYWNVDPLPPEVSARLKAEGKPIQTVFFTNLGMSSMNVPLDVRVLDPIGLVYPLASHTERLVDGRIGHDKDLFPDWVIADSGAYRQKPMVPFFVDPDWVNQAAVAISCPATQQLIASYSAPLTKALFKQNIKHALDYYSYRIDRVPEYSIELCGLPMPEPLSDAERTVAVPE